MIEKHFVRILKKVAKFMYARYNFHLKHLRLDVYFLQQEIEFSSYVP